MAFIITKKVETVTEEIISLAPGSRFFYYEGVQGEDVYKKLIVYQASVTEITVEVISDYSYSLRTNVAMDEDELGYGSHRCLRGDKSCMVISEEHFNEKYDKALSVFK